VENYTVALDLSADRITDEIAFIATSDEVKKAAFFTVGRKLGHIFGTRPESEVRQIAEDALNSVITGLLTAHAKKTTSLSMETQSEEAKTLSTPIARYLIGGVSNYCHTRLRRWSNENENGKTGTRARYYIDANRADDADFWDQHLSHEGGLDSLDQDRVNAILSSRGISEEDITLIKRNLAGWSFVDLAEDFGGTADKYRRRISRALESAGIDVNLLK
jgi:hypothetical protein